MFGLPQIRLMNASDAREKAKAAKDQKGGQVPQSFIRRMDDLIKAAAAKGRREVDWTPTRTAVEPGTYQAFHKHLRANGYKLAIQSDNRFTVKW